MQEFPGRRIWVALFSGLLLSALLIWWFDTPVKDRWIAVGLSPLAAFCELVHIFWEKLDRMHRDCLQNKK